MYEIIDINNLVVKDLKHGKELVEKIKGARAHITQQMQGKTGADWQELCDADYDLKQALHNVRSQMTRIFKTQKGVI